MTRVPLPSFEPKNGARPSNHPDSPNVPKSHYTSTSVDMIRGHTTPTTHHAVRTCGGVREGRCRNKGLYSETGEAVTGGVRAHSSPQSGRCRQSATRLGCPLVLVWKHQGVTVIS